MMNRTELSRLALLVALVALMLAVPLSCPLARAALRCLEARGAGFATALPTQN